ncbi:MAG TPA: hypothetical protein VGA06_01240 [Candidatus Paceibacterota bacterium]|jgi:hypothetical protein
MRQEPLRKKGRRVMRKLAHYLKKSIYQVLGFTFLGILTAIIAAARLLTPSAKLEKRRSQTGETYPKGSHHNP